MVRIQLSAPNELICSFSCELIHFFLISRKYIGIFNKFVLYYLLLYAKRLADIKGENNLVDNKETFMKEALKEAKKAYKKLEIPVGAVIVKDGEIIAKAHNLRESKNSSIAHAEILAIEKANKKLNAWRLENCEMYITLEPCMMCMGAIVNSRIKKIYIGALDPKTGSCKSVINMENYKFNHIVEVETGILQEDCEYILKDFFKMLRKMKRRKK